MFSARANAGTRKNVSFRQVDIQDIPYPDDSFDVVIANMMLYHVPDLRKGLTEVRRVLKPGGSFYCATTGTHGIAEYVQELLKDYGQPEPEVISEDVQRQMQMQLIKRLLYIILSNIV